MSETRTGNTVTVACKLPNGLVLKVGESKVILAGSNSSRVIGGYGLTAIPADLWAEWQKAHADTPFIKKNIVFMQTTAAKAEAQAGEQSEVKTGFEGLDPDKPAAGITPVEKK
ncbi:hypothetical protein [Gluconobacter oxydans]|uniref:hypothetical protein n=1 Tax=Gluconobacter oxydans TaxID=442 RepID=UPI00062C38CC|nr:hypothetical protein [Gluconobacter oxydans]